MWKNSDGVQGIFFAQKHMILRKYCIFCANQVFFALNNINCAKSCFCMQKRLFWCTQLLAICNRICQKQTYVEHEGLASHNLLCAVDASMPSNREIQQSPPNLPLLKLTFRKPGHCVDLSTVLNACTTLALVGELMP